MSYVPLLLVQEILPEDLEKTDPSEAEVVAIAVYDNNAGVPLTAATQRVFEGEKRFNFPTEITEGAVKTRIVYRYTLSQWRELLETLTPPSAPEALRQLMIPMLLYLKDKFPALLADIEYDRNFDPHRFARVLPMQ